jgi:hypothetical protein
MRSALLTALVATLAACSSATPQWSKAGASPQTIAADEQACRAAAPRAPHVPAPRTKVGMGGGFDSAFEQEANRMKDEDRYAASCMRDKGYEDARR